jgi:hypothetical protein
VIDEVHAAFCDARGWAQGARTRQLRRRVRQLQGCERDYRDPDYQRLMAYRHELADRGEL